MTRRVFARSGARCVAIREEQLSSAPAPLLTQRASASATGAVCCVSVTRDLQESLWKVFYKTTSRRKLQSRRAAAMTSPRPVPAASRTAAKRPPYIFQGEPFRRGFYAAQTPPQTYSATAPAAPKRWTAAGPVLIVAVICVSFSDCAKVFECIEQDANMWSSASSRMQTYALCASSPVVLA